MGDQSNIEWTDASWNPIRGCSRVSAGCEHCYAEKQAARMGGLLPADKPRSYAGLLHKSGAWNGQIRRVPELLDQPLRWKKPRRVFVNSMSDLFHEGVGYDFIDRVLAVMMVSHPHTFQVLTKRPQNMRRYFSDPELYQRVLRIVDQDIRPRFRQTRGIGVSDPTRRLPPWIQLGVSVEDQATADERIPELLVSPAAVKFVSYEPALGAVDVSPFLRRWCPSCRRHTLGHSAGDICGTCRDFLRHRIDWLIVGGESGPDARPCDVRWIESAVAQCRGAGVPVFVKQLGAFVLDVALRRERWPDEERSELDVRPRSFSNHDPFNVPREARRVRVHLRSRKGGDPAEWLESLRVREFPA